MQNRKFHLKDKDNDIKRQDIVFSPMRPYNPT